MSAPGAPTTPRAARRRPLVTLSLSPEARARLTDLATRLGLSASATVERLVREAPLPPRPRAG